jgi:DNA ligase (NAD+)
MLRPIELGGVTVSRATLHNREEVARLDVREGDTVRVQRAGDVIPQVIERVGDDRDRGEPFAMPAVCPSCGTPLIERGPYTVCPHSFECPAQRAGRIQHFASRDALDIEGLGEETARLLVDQGLVKHPPDLFDLTKEQLIPLEGFAHKSARNLIDAITVAARVELPRLLYGLGIPEVGVKVARDLAQRFGTLKALREADEERLQEVPGVGPRMAEQIAAFFREPRNREILDALLARVEPVGPPAGEGGELAGLTFVFTGALERFSRREAQRLVESHGAKTASAVSGNTDYVVAGEDAGAKLDEAHERGVKVLDEAGFVDLLRRSGVQV